MESIQTLIRNLAIIILLASFLEMLLPNQSMKGFVKLIMGLFVISAVLGPITTLLHLPQSLTIPAWTEIRSQDLPVLAGNNDAEIGRDAVQDQFKLILEHEIEALALGTTGVKTADAEVTLTAANKEMLEQPQVQNVLVLIHSSSNEGQDAERGSSSPGSLTKIVREKIAALLQISPDKINVIEKKS